MAAGKEIQYFSPWILQSDRRHDNPGGQRLEQVPLWAADSGYAYVYRRQNIHEAVVAGGEVKVRWRIYRQYVLNGGVSVIHNENKDTKKILPYYPGQTVFFKITGMQPLSNKLEVNGFCGIKAARERQIWKYQTDGPQIVSLDDYQKLDAGLGLKLAGRYELYFSAHNLLAQELHMYEDQELRTEGEPLFEGGVKVSAF